jgi:hypothetical protein
METDMRKQRPLSWLLASAALAWAGAAWAGDVKVYSGSNCKPLNATSETGYSYQLGLFNSELPGWDITCPIDRDATSTSSGFGLSAFVAPGSGPASCTAFIRKITDATDAFLDFETRATPSGGDTVVKLDWGNSLSTSQPDAVYFLECHLDVYGLMSGYRVDER